jgi:D-alanine--poly(phosphoribitol) ligase subunit 2
MAIERTKALEIVYAAIEEMNMEGENEGSNSKSLKLEEKTVLFGRGAQLESIKLVTLVIDIEQRLTDALGTEVILADEKALSQKRSPFRTIGSLVDYICGLEV